jgi:mycothione reductase
MKQYDVIVIGSGSGTAIVEEALNHELKVALVDRGPLGGTCLNLGCIPSKLLIYPADRIIDIRDSQKLGIATQINNVDFVLIMDRMRKAVQEDRDDIRRSITETKILDFYEGTGRFTGDYTMEINEETIKAGKIVIASGSRPLVPPIKGLDGIDYLTNETVLQLRKRPDDLVIIGGGYIAVEYAHFFEAMGTRVTILEIANRLVLSEEPEIATLLREELSKRVKIHTGVTVEEIKKDGNEIRVTVKNSKTGIPQEFTCGSIMVAAGRRSNADLLDLAKTGVALNERGFVKVNEYLETTKKNIWAVGDSNGQQMFTHVANREAAIVAGAIVHGSKIKMDYTAAPHAIFSYPQAASVGLTEIQAQKDHNILVGIARYSDTARGEAMQEDKGFAKAIVDKENGKILGFHIIGPEAPSLIQEVINAMVSGGNLHEINAGMHIHPAMPELIERVFANLEERK